MEPTTTHGEGEEASRSRSLARRRRRRPSARRRSSTVAESKAEPSSQRKRKRSRAAKEQSRKRRRAADKGREEEETVARRTKKRNTGDQEEAAAAPASAALGPASSSDASSAVSSPLRWPSRPSIVIRPGVEIVEPGDSEFEATYEELESKYHEKIDRYHKLPTLDHCVPRSCLVNQNLLPVRDSATRTVRQVAKAVLGLSSYMDGKLLKRSSGFLIDWDEDSKGCTILTSALLICSKSSLDEWLGTDEYFPDVEVCVHLLDKDETTVVARLLHYDKHFNLALFKIDVDVCAQIPCFSSELVCGQEAFVLGRDESLYLNIDHGSVQYKGPSVFERYHYMFINCGIGQCGAGGPVINFDGQILGMATIRGMRFIPSSIILKCLHMWKKFHCIPRLHVGMKFSAIKFLDPAHAEYLSRKCNIDEGLTVTEVSGGSVAEKIGIRAGDIMECLNGECVATTVVVRVMLENLLMSISEDHLDKRRSIGSSVDLPIGIFHTRKGCRRTRILRVNVLDDIEVISTGTCPVTARDSA